MDTYSTPAHRASSPTNLRTRISGPIITNRTRVLPRPHRGEANERRERRVRRRHDVVGTPRAVPGRGREAEGERRGRQSRASRRTVGHRPDDLRPRRRVHLVVQRVQLGRSRHELAGPDLRDHRPRNLDGRRHLVDPQLDDALPALLDHPPRLRAARADRSHHRSAPREERVTVRPSEDQRIGTSIGGGAMSVNWPLVRWICNVHFPDGEISTPFASQWFGPPFCNGTGTGSIPWDGNASVADMSFTGYATPSGSNE